LNLHKESFVYGIVTVLSRFATIVLIPILTRLLSPTEYGILNLVITIVALGNLIVTFEIAQAVTLYFTDTNRSNRNLYPSTAFLFSLLMYSILIIFFFVFGNFINEILMNDSIGNMISFYGALLLSFNGIFFLIQNQLRLEFEKKKFAFLTIGFILLTSVGAIVGAVYFNNRIEGVILGQVIGAMIIDVVGIVLLSKRFCVGFDIGKLKVMLKLSLPLVPSSLLLLGGQQMPKLILSKFGGLNDIGIFGLAMQIAGFAGFAVLGIQTAITPSILANHHKAEVPTMLGNLFEKFSTLALLLCACLSVFSIELVLVFSSKIYENASNFVPILAFAIVLNSLYIFFPGKIIKGKSSAQLIASGTSFLVSVITGIIFIKIDGIRGAALATLLSAATFFFIWVFISQKLYKIIINWRLILKSTFSTVLFCCLSILLFPPKFAISILLIKCCVLILFTYILASKYIIEIWKQLTKKQ
jgi:O-antigen/teichoic acid export membrane protein